MCEYKQLPPRTIKAFGSTVPDDIPERSALWAPLIARVTAAYLAVGVLALGAWLITGNPAWAVEFFQVPAAVLMVCLALIEFWLASLVIRHFSSDDLLRPGWTLIAASAGCQLIGMVCSQVLGSQSRINPLVLSPHATSLVPLMRHVGLLAGGTFRYGFLAGGMVFALKAYRQSGLNGRMRWIDWVASIAFAVFLVRNVVDVVVAVRAGKTLDIWEVLGWPVDPLLWVLLLQALLLFRSTGQMGNGRIGLCWRAFSVAIFLTALGDVGLWAVNYGYLPWPWSSVTWYLWLPASAAFARAPAFQLEIIHDGHSVAGRFLYEVLHPSKP